jgi:hypothetical protein
MYRTRYHFRLGDDLRMNVESTRLRRPELLRAGFYGLVLLWVNAYICRNLFFAQTAYMNSMHGFWIAIAKKADSSWFHPTWWPYWDAGIPFEFAYEPLVPGLTAVLSAVRAMPPEMAFQWVTGAVYCLAPLTLFTAAWLLTRAPGSSFAAALLYSLTAPTQILVPDQSFSIRNILDARRLFLVVVWDDTPHLAAIVLLPLVILFLSLSLRKRRLIYYWAASVLIALATLASAFGPVMVAMAALCLLFVQRENLWKNLGVTSLIGAFALAIAAAFNPPSLMKAISAASKSHFEPGFTLDSLTAIAIVILGWTILWQFLRRITSDWKLQFVALFALLTCSVPIIAAYFHRQFLLQPGRYKTEMEVALALLIAFGLRSSFARLSAGPRRALVILLLALAVEQTANLRRQAKSMLVPADVTRTVEYRASTWADQNLPGVRIMMPGSIAQWANTFSAVPQFSGSSWSIAYSQIQQTGVNSVYSGGAHQALAWLKAFGVGAAGISSPDSQEYWKGFSPPEKFEGVLPVLWRESGVTIYRIPQRTSSLAHVVPESTLVVHPPADGADIAEIERYAAALDDPSLPTAEFRWEGRNRMRIRASATPGQVISVQVSYHSGWHARVGGEDRKLNRDGLGLMWLQPGCAGPCEIELDYDGGAELRICRWISYAAIAALILVFPLRRAFRR